MRKILLAISAVTALLISCSKQAESLACFNASTVMAEVGEEITFTNCSSESFQNVWSFGDGTTSTAKDEKHKYNVANAEGYIVNLTTYAEKGNEPNSTQLKIQVMNPNQKFDKYLSGNVTKTLPDQTSTVEYKNFSITKSPINSNVVYVNNLIFNAYVGNKIIGTVSGNSITAPNMDSLTCNNVYSNVFATSFAKANFRDFTATLDPSTKKLTFSYTLNVYGAFDNTLNGNHKYSFVTAE